MTLASMREELLPFARSLYSNFDPFWPWLSLQLGFKRLPVTAAFFNKSVGSIRNAIRNKIDLQPPRGR